MPLFFMFVAVYCFFASYQAIKYKRNYWLFPSIVGFRKRKDELDPQWFSYLNGVAALIVGILLLILSLKGLID